MFSIGNRNQNRKKEIELKITLRQSTIHTTKSTVRYFCMYKGMFTPFYFRLVECPPFSRGHNIGITLKLEWVKVSTELTTWTVQGHYTCTSSTHEYS